MSSAVPGRSWGPRDTEIAVLALRKLTFQVRSSQVWSGNPKGSIRSFQSMFKVKAILLIIHTKMAFAFFPTVLALALIGRK